MALAVGLVGLVLAAAPAEAQRVHTVRRGDTMASIAHRYHVSTADLAAANRMRRGALIRPGQHLEVPSRGVVYVRRGQTLSHIARAHGCSVQALARANHMRTTSSLRVGQELRLPGYFTVHEVTPHDWGEPEEPGLVKLRSREEDMEVRLVDELGRVPREGLEQLGEVMQRADDERDRVRIPEPRLAMLLAAISDHFGGRQITVVSGFREVGGYTRETSRHVHGRATDIRVEGVPRREVWDYCRSLSQTGCGLYPRSTFVHVDVRGSAAQWVDWSGPGQAHRYGTLRGPYNRRQRHSRHRPRVGRHITRPHEVPLRVKLVGEPLPGRQDPAEDPDDDEREQPSARASERRDEPSS